MFNFHLYTKLFLNENNEGVRTSFFLPQQRRLNASLQVLLLHTQEMEEVGPSWRLFLAKLKRRSAYFLFMTKDNSSKRDMGNGS